MDRHTAAGARPRAGARLVFVRCSYPTLVFMSAGGLVAFLVRELMADEPVVDLRVFKLRSYSTGVFLMTTLGFVLYGSLVLLPIMLQTLLGYPSLQAGIAMAPRGMGSLIGMPMVGLLIGRIDPRKMVAFGLIVGAGTLFWLGQLNLNAGYWDIFWPQFFQGLGLSALFVPLTTISMDPIPRERMGNATSLFNLMRNLGGSIGIAVTGTLLARKQQEYINIMGSHVNAYSAQSQTWLESLRQGFLASGSDPVTAEAARLCGDLRRGAAPGVDGVVRSRVPDARHHLPAAAPARAADAAAARQRGCRGTLNGAGVPGCQSAKVPKCQGSPEVPGCRGAKVLGCRCALIRSRLQLARLEP